LIDGNIGEEVVGTTPPPSVGGISIFDYVYLGEGEFSLLGFVPVK